VAGLDPGKNRAIKFIKKNGYPLNKVAPKDFVSFTKPRQFQKKTSKTHQK
jgi:hypothetical protein